LRSGAGKVYERRMIWESCYWKEPLLEIAGRLRSLKTGRHRLTEKRLVELERDIFIGFYSIRKILWPVPKVSDATRFLTVQLSWYPNRKKPVTTLNSHRVDELYDFEKIHRETRDLEFIVNRIIHSFVFMPDESEKGRLVGILFNSDHDKNKKLYSMTIDDVITVFERIGNDYPYSSFHHVHPDGTETWVNAELTPEKVRALIERAEARDAEMPKRDIDDNTSCRNRPLRPGRG
jgi:hypothetical protein